MLWTDIPVHVIDFEGSARTGVVEFGVVTLRGAQIVETATRRCRGRARISGEEARVHGLSESDVESAEPFETEWLRFAALRESGLLAGHFASTENALLCATWPCPRVSPSFFEAGRSVAEWGPWIDSGRLATEVLPRETSARLEDVVSFLQLGAELESLATRACPADRCRYHCALYDALASALVLRALARDANGTAWTLTRVIAQSTGDARRRAEITQGRLF